MASALPPRPVSSSASDWMRSTRRAPNTTVAPCAERKRAVASPSPLLAPVMTTTFPSMLLLMMLTSPCHPSALTDRSFAPALQDNVLLAHRFVTLRDRSHADRRR